MATTDVTLLGIQGPKGAQGPPGAIGPVGPKGDTGATGPIATIDDTLLAPKARLINTTAPLTGGGDLSTDRTLAISGATDSAAGTMSAADKTRLDAATPNSSPITLMARGGSGETIVQWLAIHDNGNNVTPLVPLELVRDLGATAGAHPLLSARRTATDGGIVAGYQADGSVTLYSRLRGAGAGLDLHLGTESAPDTLVLGDTAATALARLTGSVSASGANLLGLDAGALTLAPAATFTATLMALGGTVTAGIGVTLPSASGLVIGTLAKTGTGTVTAAAALVVNTPTAGTTNYAATFLGTGNIGIGVAAPANPLHLERDLGTAATENLLARFRRTSAGGGIDLGYVGTGAGAVAYSRLRGSGAFDLHLGTATTPDALILADATGNATLAGALAINGGVVTTTATGLQLPGVLGIGLTVDPAALVSVGGTVAAAATNAGLKVVPTLTAQAASSSYGLWLAATFATTAGALTGLSAAGLYLGAPTVTGNGTFANAGTTAAGFSRLFIAQASIGTGTATNAYGLYANAPTGATNNWAGYFAGAVRATGVVTLDSAPMLSALTGLVLSDPIAGTSALAVGTAYQLVGVNAAGTAWQAQTLSAATHVPDLAVTVTNPTSSTPTVNVAAGSYWNGANTETIYAGGSTTLTRPGSNSEYDLVGLNNAGAIVVTRGVAGASPAKFACPIGILPLGWILLPSGTAAPTVTSARYFFDTPTGAYWERDGYFPGKNTGAYQTMDLVLIDKAMSIPTNGGTGTAAKVLTNPASTATFYLCKNTTATPNTTNFGTIAISTGGVATITITATTFAAGDYIALMGPTTADTTLSDLLWVLTGVYV